MRARGGRKGGWRKRRKSPLPRREKCRSVARNEVGGGHSTSLSFHLRATRSHVELESGQPGPSSHC